MNSLTPEKRKQLLALAIGVVLFVSGAWYLVIRHEYAKLSSQASKIAEVQAQVEKAKHNNRMLDHFEGDFKNSLQELQRLEERMGTGDVYRWMLHIFEQLQTSNNVSVVNIDPPRLRESDIPPQVPYRMATFSVSGTAYYHDFGVFLAALENELPFARLEKLELKQASFTDSGSEDREKLSFTMELSTLAKLAFFNPGTGGPTSQ